MDEAEKILKGVMLCIRDDCKDCPYRNELNCSDLMLHELKDALIESRERKRPGIAQDAKGIWMTCGKCGSHMKALYPNDPSFYVIPKYCPNCGTGVLWDGHP